MSISCQRLIHQTVSQPTLVATISSLISSTMRTRTTSRTRKRWKRMTKRNLTVITRRKKRHCCVPQRNGLCLPLRVTLRCSVVSNVAAFCHRFQTGIPRPRMSRTSAAIHLQDLTTPQALSLLLPVRPALREIQVMDGVYRRTISDGCHLRAAELARRDHQRKGYEPRTREASQAVRKSSWVDGGRLTAPGLVQNWRQMKVVTI